MCPSIFNIYFCEIFFDIIECGIASYAGYRKLCDNTPYNFDFSLTSVIGNIETSIGSLLNLFRENHIKVNAYKYHPSVSSNESCTAKIEDYFIRSSTS